MTAADLATVRAELAAREPTLRGARRGVVFHKDFAGIRWVPLTGTALGAALIELCRVKGIEGVMLFPPDEARMTWNTPEGHWMARLIPIGDREAGELEIATGIRLNRDVVKATAETWYDALELAYHAATTEGV